MHKFKLIDETGDIVLKLQFLLHATRSFEKRLADQLEKGSDFRLISALPLAGGWTRGGKVTVRRIDTNTESVLVLQPINNPFEEYEL